MQVVRFDAASLGSAKRTPQGFLRAPARLTRTGVLTYRRPDGTVVRELRRPEQVFKPESLATLADAPVTDLHPKEMVSPTNSRSLALGHVSNASARADGRFVGGEVVVTDAQLIAAVEGGSRREVSMGYTCKLVAVPGVYNGEHYDAEQTDIVYNHAALGPPKWGRAGSEVALRLDGAAELLELGALDAYVLDAAEAPELDQTPKGKQMELVTIRLDGIDVQVPPQSQQLITRTLEQRDSQLAAKVTELKTLQARLDALQGELDGTKKNLEQAADPKRFDTAVAERLELLERARPLLGDTVKLDGLTAREIKVKVLTHLDPKADYAGKSDEYVQGRFDSAELPDAAVGGKGKNVSSVRRAAAPATERADGGDGKPKYAPPPWRRALRASADER